MTSEIEFENLISLCRKSTFTSIKQTVDAIVATQRKITYGYQTGTMSRETACACAIMCLRSRLSPLAAFASAFIFEHKLMSLSLKEINPRLLGQFQCVDDCYCTDAELKTIVEKKPNSITGKAATYVLKNSDEYLRARYQTDMYRKRFIDFFIAFAPKELPILVCDHIARFFFGQERTQLVPFHITFGIAHNVQQSWTNRKKNKTNQQNE